MNRLDLTSLKASMLAALAVTAFGCDDDAAHQPRPLVATLSSVASCEELLDRLREDASMKVRD